jgi:hypothetical protein
VDYDAEYVEIDLAGLRQAAPDAHLRRQDTCPPYTAVGNDKRHAVRGEIRAKRRYDYEYTFARECSDHRDMFALCIRQNSQAPADVLAECPSVAGHSPENGTDLRFCVTLLIYRVASPWHDAC